MRILAVCLAWLASLLPHHGNHGHAQRGRATTFGPWHTAVGGGDRLAGHKAACDYPSRRARATREELRLFREGHFIASRTLPCFQVVTLCSEDSGRCGRGVVGDFGPARAMADVWHSWARELRHRGGFATLVVESQP